MNCNILKMNAFDKLKIFRLIPKVIFFSVISIAIEGRKKYFLNFGHENEKQHIPNARGVIRRYC